MIRFNKASQNNVVVTLRENSSVAAPIYLFLFTNQQSKVDYYFIGTDISQYTQRFNQFLITEKPNANTLNGEVSLGNEGFYNYTAYQTSLVNTEDLVTAADAVPFIVKTVEVGLVWVVPAAADNSAYTPQSETSTVYQPTGLILTEGGDLILTEGGYLIEME